MLTRTRRRLRLQRLDARELLAADIADFVVTTLEDELDANPAADLADLSLREAIALSDAASGADVIAFADGLVGTIRLDSALGALEIDDELSIHGLGPGDTIIDAVGGSRVFEILSTSGDVLLESVTLTGGRADGQLQQGGGIRSESSRTLTLSDVVVAENATSGTGSAGGGIATGTGDLIVLDSVIERNRVDGTLAGGGGIVTLGGDVTIRHSVIRENSVIGENSFGGGIYALGGFITIESTAIESNTTDGSFGRGGGIELGAADGLILNSTIAENRTFGLEAHGGGISQIESVLTIRQSTLSNNAVGGTGSGGGGLYLNRSVGRIENSTIVENDAAAVGGGIGTSQVLVSVSLLNTVVANNTDLGVSPDFESAGAIDSDSDVRFSLIGDNAGTTLDEAQTPDLLGNLIGDVAGGGVIDPQLDTLADNGGPTRTHRPIFPTSPLVDAGDPEFDITTLPRDQRGGEFDRLNGSRIDMGAVETTGSYSLRWETPDPIVVGTPLGDDQLDATASIPGTFVYSPEAGALLTAGAARPLTVTFTPDAPNEPPTTRQVAIDVLQAIPALTWPAPDPIVVGTPLGYAQLNAAADVEGTFVYDPALGTVLDAGDNQMLSVTFTPADVINYEVVERTVTIDVTESHDYGDAPDTFPVIFVQNGASHEASSLRLGETITFESDGAATPGADGDAGDDGVVFLTPLLATGAEAQAIVEVTSSGDDARLDGWIDFNGDGDWFDAGEQVLASRVLSAGPNVLAIDVPASLRASATAVAARFRLSSTGGLSVTGSASDGEVEDYLIPVLDAATPRSIEIAIREINSVEFAPSSVTVSIGDPAASPAVVTWPVAAVESIMLVGEGADQRVDLSGFRQGEIPLIINGGGGVDELRIAEGVRRLDFTDPSLDVSGIPRIDASDAGVITIGLDAAAIERLSPQASDVFVQLGVDGQLDFADDEPWRPSEPQFDIAVATVVGTFAGSGTQVTVTRDAATVWQNVIRPGDTNADGAVTPLDALVVIIELSRPQFSDPTTAMLAEPSALTGGWPGLYFDRNRDGRVTPSDALGVIIDLADLNDAGAETEAIEIAVRRRSASHLIDDVDDRRRPLATISVEVIDDVMRRLV